VTLMQIQKRGAAKPLDALSSRTLLPPRTEKCISIDMH
jgi:hypothetical protein